MEAAKKSEFDSEAKGNVSATSDSRLANDFICLKKLGFGSFGEVLKVQHKLDKREYAVKRVKIKLDDHLDVATREVGLLSAMNHKNIVKYHNSWIDSGALDDVRRIIKKVF